MSAPAQHQLATLTEENAGVPGEKFAALVHQIRAEFVESECHTLLLSAEDFCGLKKPGILAEAFPAFRTEVFLSLRPQYDILSPFYYTAVAMRRTTLAPEEFLEAHLRNFLNYHDMLARWRVGFPDAGYHVRRYERGSPARTNSVADFVTVLGLPLPPAESSAESRYHATLPARGTLALRSLAMEGCSDAEFWAIYKRLSENPELFGQEMSVYSPACRLAVHEAYRQSNRRVRAEFVDGRDEDLFEEPELPDHERWAAAVGDTTTIGRDVSLLLAAQASGLDVKSEA
jgi:hypothetical protein